MPDIALTVTAAPVKAGRYIVRSVPPIPPATYYYVFDQSETPARTVAVCTCRKDAELVRGGLELLDALSAVELNVADVDGAPV